MQGGANRSEQVLGNRFSRETAQFKFPKILEKLVHDKAGDALSADPANAAPLPSWMRPFSITACGPT